MPARLLVIAVGNPSRGDDALGPLLLERLAPRVVPAQVELLTDFQLQVEHALDLRGRDAVLFVDAARPGAAGDGVSLQPLQPASQAAAASHALTAAEVLHVAHRLDGRWPAAWQLAIEGEEFALGAPLGTGARARLARAECLVLDWIAARVGG